MSTYYVHKEPVFDKKRSFFGNEFVPEARIERKRRGVASTECGRRGWSELLSSEGGFESLGGEQTGFSLSLDVAAVKGPVLAFLPRDSIFQVPERDALDKDVVLGTATLKKEWVTRLRSTTLRRDAVFYSSTRLPILCGSMPHLFPRIS